MLMAIIESLRKYKADIRIIVLSRNPAETMKMYRVNAFNRLNLLNVLQVMKKSRLFIYGGGNLIQDNTSTRSLFFYLGTTWLAKRLGLKVMFYGNGIGPLKKQANRRLTSRIIDQVDVITLREELSLKELKSLGIGKPRIIMTADPAMTVSAKDPIQSENALKRQGIVPGTPLVGFSVRKYPGHEDFKHEAYEDHAGEIWAEMMKKRALNKAVACSKAL
jgi:polysaccharide pyruvyl transferase CsaB